MLAGLFWPRRIFIAGRIHVANKDNQNASGSSGRQQSWESRCRLLHLGNIKSFIRHHSAGRAEIILHIHDDECGVFRINLLAQGRRGTNMRQARGDLEVLARFAQSRISSRFIQDADLAAVTAIAMSSGVIGV